MFAGCALAFANSYRVVNTSCMHFCSDTVKALAMDFHSGGLEWNKVPVQFNCYGFKSQKQGKQEWLLALANKRARSGS